ncbi:hypothetical protein AGMMS50225_08400 [Betaproteobacteria bacterium]|nr:hypothetical protein AGMMS50225_08400 [Betaproteobacteria bacterium]
MDSRGKDWIAALFLMGVASTAAAQDQVYRCTTPSGAVEYTQTPCTAGNQQRLVRTDDPLSGTDPDAAKRQLDEMIRDLIARREYDRAWSMAMTNAQRAAVTAARNADPVSTWQAESEARRAEVAAANAARDAAEAEASRNARDANVNWGTNYGVWYPPSYWNGAQGRRPPYQRPPYPHAPSRPATPVKPPPGAHPPAHAPGASRLAPAARTLAPGATVRSGVTKPLPAGDEPRTSVVGRKR